MSSNWHSSVLVEIKTDAGPARPGRRRMDSLSLFREVWEMLVQDRPADFPVRRSQNDQTVALLPESEVLVVGMAVLSLVGETPPPRQYT